MIKTFKLCFKYEYSHDDKLAIDNMDLNIKKGEFISIIGHNGSGKSTFAKISNAILIPTGGYMLINDMDTRKEELVWDIRRTAGMVFQNPDNQIVATIVEEDVAFGPENLGLDTEVIRQRVDFALKAVGMYDLRRKPPHLLSGGQKQRVAIAGILAMKPECIIFDEPTAMLDPAGRNEVMETIKQLNEEGITVVNITHFMDEAVNSTKVVVMDNGIKTIEGNPKDVFSNVERLQEIGLDVPQVTLLAHKLRNEGIDIAEGIITIEEMADSIEKLMIQNKCVNEPYKVESSSEAKKETVESDHIIKVENLNYIYDPGTPFETKALDDVSLKIRKNVFTGIIGHTGSGKSTLIQHLNGLMKPTSGKISVNGYDITSKKMSLIDIRKKVGLVFQYPEYQLFEETVHKDVAFGPQNMGLSKSVVDERVKEAIELVGLDYESIKDKSPFELSGGQKRRVAIAGVMAMKPDVLILDEPTAGLDPRGREEILGKLQELHNVGEMTVVLVSHSMEDIARYVDEIIVMNQGKIFLKGDARTVFNHHDKLKEIGLGLPQVTELARELSNRGIILERNPLTVDEMFIMLITIMKGN